MPRHKSFFASFFSKKEESSFVFQKAKRLLCLVQVRQETRAMAQRGQSATLGIIARPVHESR
jgi:hypothetical protein